MSLELPDGRMVRAGVRNNRRNLGEADHPVGGHGPEFFAAGEDLSVDITVGRSANKDALHRRFVGVARSETLFRVYTGHTEQVKVGGDLAGGLSGRRSANTGSPF